MGKGLIPADPETWKVRRKAIVPGFHKAWLNAMVGHFSFFPPFIPSQTSRPVSQQTFISFMPSYESAHQIYF